MSNILHVLWFLLTRDITSSELVVILRSRECASEQNTLQVAVMWILDPRIAVCQVCAGTIVWIFWQWNRFLLRMCARALFSESVYLWWDCQCPCCIILDSRITDTVNNPRYIHIDSVVCCSIIFFFCFGTEKIKKERKERKIWITIFFLKILLLFFFPRHNFGINLSWTATNIFFYKW